jgi:glycosyltransferase involved in cell wall biosynthesis
MPRFSLIVPTSGRTVELAVLLASIVNQNRMDVEIIVVDQNEDDRVVPLVKALPSSITVLHLRQEKKSSPVARNTGLDAASGEIVVFPDDDCWYPPDLLNRVDSWFKANSRYAVLAVGALDDEGKSSGNRWLQDACDINPLNAMRTTFSSSLFISAVQPGRLARFDPKLPAGEETDFILRLLAKGFRGRFDRELHIHHPRRDMLSGTISLERAKKYGTGMGMVARRHSLVLVWCGLLMYDLARALLVSVRGQFVNTRFCLAHTAGLFQGFVNGDVAAIKGIFKDVFERERAGLLQDRNE